MSEKRVTRSPAKTSNTSEKTILGRRKALKGLGVLAIAAPAFSACSSGGGGAGTGGSGTGGAGTGGAGTGGAATGGSATGGAATGGAATGGKAATGGAATGGAQATGGAAGGATAATGGAGGSSGMTGMLTSPQWTDVPVQDSTNADMPKKLSCASVTKTDAAGQGPFFIHNLEKDNDIEFMRQDIRGQYNPSATKGVDMELHVRLVDSTTSDKDCTKLVPVPDIEVYIWHTDAQGYYSGFGNHGGPREQMPDTPYMSVPDMTDLDNTDRFCRGTQVTNADGVASFLSTFPGWYNGRDLHIHIVCFKKGSKAHGRTTYSKSVEPMWIFTTQFYFDPKFSKSIHEAYEPYKTRTKLSAYEDAMKADEAGNSGRHCTATKVGDKVIAQIQMVVNPT